MLLSPRRLVGVAREVEEQTSISLTLDLGQCVRALVSFSKSLLLRQF
jgi:hypothetical protein